MYQGNEQDKPEVYFTVLVVLQIIIFIFSMVSLQNDLSMFNILRIMMLVMAKCCQATSMVVQYIIFAFICALLSFDPVGLWISGHGQKRNGGQNALCVIVFLCLCIATYGGYLFKRSFEKQIDQNFSNGYSIPQQNVFRQPQQNEYQQPSRQQNRHFQQFSGQGYSLS